MRSLGSMVNSIQRKVTRWIETALVLISIFAFLYPEAAWWQGRIANAASQQMETGERPSSPDNSNLHSNVSGVIGRIQIPDLHLSAPITNGIGKLELIRGVGHVPGSALAGGLGTMALAGHRDTFFRSLRNVEPGMQIRVSGEGGTYRYDVDATQIVTPEQVDVLEIGSDPALVLITCYPFNYIGAAPKRFIVHAKLLSVAPDPSE